LKFDCRFEGGKSLLDLHYFRVEDARRISLANFSLRRSTHTNYLT